MSWITIIWSGMAGACIALAVLQLLVWFNSRDSWPYLLFAITALAGAGTALLELALMQSQSPSQYGALLRLYHVPIFVIVVGLVWFIRSYLKAGRLWLAWLITGIRVLILILNFSMEPNLNFTEITSLQSFSFMDETVVVPIGEKNPWTNITIASGYLFLIFVLDAAFSAWRGGNRRRAAVLGITMGVAIAIAIIHTEMLARGILPVPVSLSIPFLMIVFGFAFELSVELVRVNRLAGQLSKTEQRLELATSGADVGVWDWNIERDEVWVSDTIRRLFDLREDDRPGLDSMLLNIHPDDRDAVQQVMRKVLSEQQDIEFECRLITANDEVRWTRARGYVERGPTGKPLHMRGVSIDITDQKQADARSREAAELNEKVLASLRSQIAIVDRDGIILAVNSAWQSFASQDDRARADTGVNYLQVCERAVVTGDTTAGRAATGITSVLQGRDDFFEMEYPCGLPGDNRFFVMRVVPLLTGEGGAVISHTEITHRKRAEMEATELRRELAHAQRVDTLGQLSSALAHEINQPLGAILRNVEAAELFLRQESPDLEELGDIVRDIRRDEQRASSVIERMRSLMKRRELQLETLAMDELIEQVMKLLRTEIQLRHIRVQVDVATDLPRVRGDRVHLQQVVLNLVINSMDACHDLPNSNCQIVIKSSQSADNVIQLTVSDNGPGIAPEVLGKLFEPFVTTKANGTGLGLAISKNIVEMHGGGLSAENNPQGGATFCLVLPIVGKS